MDYFVEIAENPDIQEALGRLYNEPNHPEHLQQTRPGEDGPLLSDTHPSIWRAEIVNWFHLHPGFAAAVWRELAFCISERKRLARAAWTASWYQRYQLQSIMKKIGLEATADEIEKERKFADATSANIEDLRKELGLAYRGPEFIERLILLDSRPRTTETIAALITNVTEVRELAEKYGVPVPFAMVHEREMEQIAEYRKGRSPANSGEPDAANDTNGGTMPSFDGAPIRRALANNLVGLAFSGGGIRSATFNLGVLQSLANLDVLRHCDYLSTVSGGGYIGSWFSAWTLREAQQISTTALTPSKRAQDRLRLLLSPLRSPYPLDICIRPIRYLREFSNYLTPQTGFFSADTWTMIAIYIRNLLLNLLVLIPLIAAILIVPRLTYDVGWRLFEWKIPAAKLIPPWLAFGAAPWFFDGEVEGTVLLIIAIGVTLPLTILLPNLRRASPPASALNVAAEPRRNRDTSSKVPWYAHPGRIQLLVVIPFLVAASLTATHYWMMLHRTNQSKPDETIMGVAYGAGVIFFIYLGLIHWVGRFYRCWTNRAHAVLSLVIATLGAAGAAGGIFWILGKIFLSFGDAEAGYARALGFGTPLTLATYSLVVVVQLGLLGAKFPDEQREWWSRLRAWTLIYSLAWTALFTLALWVPDWWTRYLWNSNYLGANGGISALVAWAISTFAGIQTGRSGATANTAVNTRTSLSGRVSRIVALVAPYIFIVGLLALVSFGVHQILEWRLNPQTPGDWLWVKDYPFVKILVTALALFVVSVFVSWRIGVNEFSMHHFYKNRLVRCYLGASRWRTRKADWFTGFDSNDDIHMSRFDNRPPPNSNRTDWNPYPGPYPIVNAALNLVAGEDLAWQERKATSFVFTPKYCGYDLDRAVLQKDKGDYWPDGYAPTRCYVNEGQGPTLGTAMAISGAAANPNMGKVTSAASAFLMTVFNARLGWWLPNPRRKSWPFGWNRSGPALGINYTAIELFGMTDDNKKFVNVSDGGHFENLGAYELVRRGCRYVIVSDAGQDGSFALEDLGNLIRKCRTDFGVEIEIGTDLVRDRNTKGWSSTHCVVGKIHYLTVPKHDTQGNVIYDSAGQPDHEKGLLLYLKPSITGEEPFDVLEYYRRVPEFPHESTADQWFDESQFESYRRLGMHVAETAFIRYRQQPDEPIDTNDLFENLKQFWHPPSPKVAEHSTAHAQEYMRIMELLRTQKSLSFLDPTIFQSITTPPGGLGSQRDEFYVCNALIQLMENVYTDLDLEQNHSHPHVEGWMKVFEDWVKQPAFIRTWTISENTYATRFRNFYNDRLVK